MTINLLTALAIISLGVFVVWIRGEIPSPYILALIAIAFAIRLALGGTLARK
jgi:hypothetical protein